MAKPDRFIVGLDIGSTKVCALIGELSETGRVEIIGKGTAATKGTRKGNIVNLEATIVSIKKATEEAEIMAGVQIERAQVGISGSHVKGFNSRGVIAVTGRREITREDITRVLDAAKSVSIPQDREILHVIPQEFVVDDQDGIHDPLGMVGSRLEANVHVVTGAVTLTQNVLTAVNRAGIEVADLVLEQLAVSEAVLTADERELGVALLDIGGGTTEYAVFHHGAVILTGVVPIGGDHFTNDIAVVLRTPIPEAEKIKKKYGCALMSMVGEEESIEVVSVGGRAAKVLSRQLLTEILQPRTEELFTILKDEWKRVGMEKGPRGGVVLTGGGSELEGINEVAEQIFDAQIRKGTPAGLAGLTDVIASPEWGCAAGLILYAERNGAGRRGRSLPGSPVYRLMHSVKSLFADFL